MSSTGTSRGYGADEPEPVVVEDHHAADADHADDHGHHGIDPNRVEPSASTFDDVYITMGGPRGSSEPVGFLPPSKILETLTPPPIPYQVNIGRAIWAGLVATFTITPIFVALYFGYKDTCFDIGLMLGSIFLPTQDWVTRLVGLGVHMVIGALFAVTYAYMSYIFRTEGNGGRGTQFGIGLWFVMMNWVYPISVGLIARYGVSHTAFDNPDFLLNQTGPSNVGWAPLVVTLLMHMLWGLIVGHIYRHKVVIKQNENPALAPVAA